MAFLSRFFSRPETAPLPTLEELLREHGLPGDLPGLEHLLPEFEHLKDAGRRAFAAALAELSAHGWPLPPDWVDAQFDLLPQIVPSWQAEREGYFQRPVIDGLSERILACGQVVPAAWFTLWGVSEEDIRERALDQLREHSKDKPFRRAASGIYESTFGDGMDAARILLPELWSGLFPGQNTFAAVPAADVLLVAPQVLLPRLVEGIQKALAAAGARVAGTIYQRVDDHTMPATLQDPHPIAQPQRELRQADGVAAYRAQEQDLDPALGVACPLAILRTQQGRSVSFAAWQEGSAVLLPESDLVGFIAKDGRPMGIYFRQTLPRISELKGTAVDIWGPRRLRFEGFPTPAQLERLERFADAEQMAGIFKTAGAPSRPPAPPKAQGSPDLMSTSSPVPAHLRGLSLGVQSDD